MKSVLVMLMLVMETTAMSWGKDLYVHCRKGNDSNDGTITSPVRTIQAAVNRAGKGDVIHLQPASALYRQTVIFQGMEGITLEGNGVTLTGAIPLPAEGWEPAGNELHRLKIKKPYKGRYLLISQGKPRRITNLVCGKAAPPSSQPAGLPPGEFTVAPVPGNDREVWLIVAGPLDNLELAVKASGLRTAGRNRDLRVRNLNCRNYLNDGFNIHGDSRGLRFDNITGYDCYDEGFSAHDTCECRVESGRFWGNYNAIADVNNAETEYNQCEFSRSVNADVLFEGGRHRLTGCRIVSTGRDALSAVPALPGDPLQVFCRLIDCTIESPKPAAPARIVADKARVDLTGSTLRNAIWVEPERPAERSVAGPVAGSPRARAETAEQSFPSPSLSTPILQQALGTDAVGICLVDGRTGQKIPLGVPKDVRRNADDLSFCRAGQDFVVRQVVRPGRDGQIHWQVRVENQGGSEARLEVACEGLFRKPRPWTFYDAYGVTEIRDEPIAGTATFWPAIALMGPRAGVWIGVEPHQFFSLFAYSLTGSPAANAEQFRFGPRIMMAPGHTETIEFVLLPFVPEYGYRSALDAYYKAFPDLFRPTPGIDPRLIRGGCATDVTWRKAACRGDQSPPEVARRCATTWDWMYGPFLYPGDYYLRKERWALLDPARRGESINKWKQAEAFQAFRNRYFRTTDLDYGCAPAFYTCNWAHEDLARSIYADSLMSEDMGWENRPGSKPGWIAREGGYVKYGPWQCVEVFPYPPVTGAGRQFARDFSDLAEADLPFSAVAFDSNVCAGKYRGPKVNELPGRAWDEKGVFCSEGIAQAKIAEYLHTLRKAGRPIGVVSNHAPTHYTMAFRTDAAILELTPSRIVRPNGSIVPREYTRAQMGHKPRTIHFKFHKLSQDVPLLADWEALTSAQLRNRICTIQDRILLFALTYGWNLSPDLIMGDARMLKFAGILAELNSRGWQPIPAMKIDRPDAAIMLARYGEGERSILTVGNNAGRTVTIPIQLDNKYFNAKTVLWADYWGRPLQVQSRSDLGRISATVASRDVMILKPLVFLNADGPILGQATETQESHGGRIQAAFDCDGSLPKPAAVRIAIPDGMTVVNAIFNGRSADCSYENGLVDVRVPGLARKNALEVNFASADVLCRQSEILDFPFLQGKAAIVLAQSASEYERAAAFRLAEYFRYWVFVDRNVEFSLPIVTQKPLPESLAVYIGTAGTGPRGVSFDGKNLRIAGRTPSDTYALTLKVLAILDRRYPVTGVYQNQIGYPDRPLLSSSTPKDQEEMKKILIKAGVWGKPIRTTTAPAPILDTREAPGARVPEATSRPHRSTVRLLSSQDFTGSSRAPFELTDPRCHVDYIPDCHGLIPRFTCPGGGDAAVRLLIRDAKILTGRTTVIVRLRLQAPSVVEAGRFALGLPAGPARQEIFSPEMETQVLRSGQWYDLTFDINRQPIVRDESLYLYFAYQDGTPITFDLAQVSAA